MTTACAPTSQQMEESFNRQALVRRCIKEALSRSFFSVYLQPLWSLSAQRLWSGSALCRLIHPEVGSISPAEFIPVAEEEGYIGQIGRRQFRRLCAFVAQHSSQLEQMGIQWLGKGEMFTAVGVINTPRKSAGWSPPWRRWGFRRSFPFIGVRRRGAPFMDESVSACFCAVSAGGL